MTGEFKYIVYEDWNDLETMVIFPPHVVHAEMARALCPTRAVLGAGFISFDANLSEDGETPEPNVRCYGESMSLNVPSRGALDNRLAARMMPWR